MSTQEDAHQKIDPEAWKYAEKAMTWYGWGSPVGVGLLLLAAASAVAMLKHTGVF